MSGRLAQRYWASLTDADVESRDHLIEEGRRKDLPLWRRYLASLLDVQLSRGEHGSTERLEPGEVDRGPTGAVHFELDPIVAVGGSAPAAPAVPLTERRRRLAVLALAAAFAAATVIGVPLYMTSREPAPSPIVIGTLPRPSPPPGAHIESGGFAWVTPKGWRRDVKTGSEVHYTSPDATQELAAKASRSRGDLLESWQKSEKNARRGDGYKKIRLEEATFDGWPAVVWEYTFSLQGVSWRALLLAFDVDGVTYQINTWYQPQIEKQALLTYRAVRDSFTVLGPSAPSTVEVTSVPPSTGSAPQSS